MDEHPEFFANGILVHNCVSMSLFVIKSRLRSSLPDAPPPPLDPVQELRAGRPSYAGGHLHHAHSVPLSYLEMSDVDRLLYPEAPPARGTRV